MSNPFKNIIENLNKKWNEKWRRKTHNLKLKLKEKTQGLGHSLLTSAQKEFLWYVHKCILPWDETELLPWKLSLRFPPAARCQLIPCQSSPRKCPPKPVQARIGRTTLSSQLSRDELGDTDGRPSQPALSNPEKSEKLGRYLSFTYSLPADLKKTEMCQTYDFYEKCYVGRPDLEVCWKSVF